MTAAPSGPADATQHLDVGFGLSGDTVRGLPAGTPGSMGFGLSDFRRVWGLA